MVKNGVGTPTDTQLDQNLEENQSNSPLHPNLLEEEAEACLAQLQGAHLLIPKHTKNIMAPTLPCLAQLQSMLQNNKCLMLPEVRFHPAAIPIFSLQPLAALAAYGSCDPTQLFMYL